MQAMRMASLLCDFLASAEESRPHAGGAKTDTWKACDRLLAIPPLGEAAGRGAGPLRVVRCVVVGHQAGPHRILEVDDVEAGGRLIEAVAIAARVHAQQAAQHEA